MFKKVLAAVLTTAMVGSMFTAVAEQKRQEHSRADYRALDHQLMGYRYRRSQQDHCRGSSCQIYGRLSEYYRKSGTSAE